MAYLRLLVAEARSDAVQELLEVHLPAQRLQLADHVEDGRVLRLEPQALHG